MSFAAMILVACLLDIAIGWPDAVYRRFGHPVTWIGALIDVLERRLNAGTERQRLWAGAVTTALVLVAVASVAVFVQRALPDDWIGVLIGGFFAWPWIAIRSMHEHVAAVGTPLSNGDIQTARRAVSMIVGRNPELLDEAGIARSSLESLAENTSDGIFAPVFWGVLGGLPGLVVYKAINTLDSMIGHRNVRYEHFGKVAARLDDFVNLVPARLTGFVFALVSAYAQNAFRVMFKDARAHRSPNAGWAEGAVAGALQVRLSGPRVYEDQIAEEPWMNGDAVDPGPADIEKGLALFRRAIGCVLVALVAIWVVGI